MIRLVLLLAPATAVLAGVLVADVLLWAWITFTTEGRAPPEKMREEEKEMGEWCAKLA